MHEINRGKTMFGNLLNNVLIEDLIEAKEIIIQDFDPNKLQIAQYPLSPREIIYEKNDNTVGTSNLIESKEPYILKPNEYAIVIVSEIIILGNAIVGRFIPMSGLIEMGFGLTAGKLDPHYGENNQRIRFGLTNLRNRNNPFGTNSPLAYIEFYDLRGLPKKDIKESEYDKFIKEMTLPDRMYTAMKDIQEWLRKLESKKNDLRNEK